MYLYRHPIVLHCISVISLCLLVGFTLKVGNLCTTGDIWGDQLIRRAGLLPSIPPGLDHRDLHLLSRAISGFTIRGMVGKSGQVRWN